MSSAPASEPSPPPECAVCLQPSIHPVQLDCNHIFCFLCVKGASTQSRRCPMCRRGFPANYLDNPKLIRPLEEETNAKPEKEPAAEDGDVEEEEEGEEETEEERDGEEHRVRRAAPRHSWFYEGHNGWWQYDERTSAELESHRRAGSRTCEVLIAGYVYVIDLELMLQSRRDEPARRRRIKRDRAEAPKKGIAGLRIARSRRTGEEDGDEEREGLPYPALAPDDHPGDGGGAGPTGAAAASSARSAEVRVLGERLATGLTLRQQEGGEEHVGGSLSVDQSRLPPPPPPPRRQHRRQDEQ